MAIAIATLEAILRFAMGNLPLADRRVPYGTQIIADVT
jgi:hypothetical protein